MVTLFFFFMKDSGHCTPNLSVSSAEGRANCMHTDIITNPGGTLKNTPTHKEDWNGAVVGENETSSCTLQALGVPGLRTVSHRHEQNVVWRVQTTWPLCSRDLTSHLGIVQTGRSVINPSGSVSPGGTTHSAALGQGFGGIWAGSALSDTASPWLTSRAERFWPLFV